LKDQPFRSLVPSVSLREVREASAADLFAEWQMKINDAQWLADGHNVSYLVLNVCRILHT
jgi:hypothetical protein